MSEDIKKQVVYEIKHSAFSMFSLQLDETTHVTHCAHQIAFIRVTDEQLPTDNIHTQEQFVDRINDDEVKAKFTQLPPNQFWCSVASEYPLVSEMALRVFLSFPTTYECESGFSSRLTIKTKSRNRLDVKDDIRFALSKTTPGIKPLVSNKQHHPSQIFGCFRSLIAVKY
ncbi:unnamed protein product [Caretta caretta]